MESAEGAAPPAAEAEPVAAPASSPDEPLAPVAESKPPPPPPPPPVAESVPVTKAAPQLAAATVSVKLHVSPGDTVLLVGSDASIGSWDLQSAVPLTWSDGDVWSVAGLELDERVEAKARGPNLLDNLYDLSSV